MQIYRVYHGVKVLDNQCLIKSICLIFQKKSFRNFDTH
jgi:hypothetical protein